MSLDGFVNAAHASLDNPVGDGGVSLHGRIMSGENEVDSNFLEASIGNPGAVIRGRRRCDAAQSVERGESGSGGGTV